MQTRREVLYLLNTIANAIAESVEKTANLMEAQ
jgi:hypothetical protein